MSRLPDRPSDLLELALVDLALAEADGRYLVNMWHWHLPALVASDEACEACLAGSVMAFSLGADRLAHLPALVASDEACEVCLAGSVMAFSLKADRLAHLAPGDFDKDTTRKLNALDSFRMGHVFAGLVELGFNMDQDMHEAVARMDTFEGVQMDRDVRHYDNCPSGFRDDMEELVADLRAAGL